MIRVPQLRVIDEEGTQLGVMPTSQALRLAQERGYDLVEVAPTTAPPVARLLDYGQFKYEKARQEKEARRHQRSVDFKEIRIRPKIGKGDFDTKVHRAIQFLGDGDRIKVTVQFRGREVSHAYIGRDLLIKFGEQIAEHGTVERQPVLEGKSMSMVITSLHKPRPSETPARSPARAAEAPARTSEPPVRASDAPVEAAQVAPAQAPADGEKARPVSAATAVAAEMPADQPAGG